MGWILAGFMFFVGTAYGNYLGETRARKLEEEHKRIHKQYAHDKRSLLNYCANQNDELEHYKGANEYLRNKLERAKLYGNQG